MDNPPSDHETQRVGGAKTHRVFLLTIAPAFFPNRNIEDKMVLNMSDVKTPETKSEPVATTPTPTTPATTAEQPATEQPAAAPAAPEQPV